MELGHGQIFFPNFEHLPNQTRSVGGITQMVVMVFRGILWTPRFTSRLAAVQLANDFNHSFHRYHCSRSRCRVRKKNRGCWGVGLVGRCVGGCVGVFFFCVLMTHSCQHKEPKQVLCFQKEITSSQSNATFHKRFNEIHHLG